MERLTAQYTTKFANPFAAAARGFLDAVIAPSDTRRAVCRELQRLQEKVGLSAYPFGIETSLMILHHVQCRLGK